tara:strand:- start:2868 stop:3338 length:471 start_codon:yes stop_codon:yes gene_type:complete
MKFQHTIISLLLLPALGIAYPHCNGPSNAITYSNQSNCGGGGSVWYWKNCTDNTVSASLRNSSGDQVCGAGQVGSGGDVKTLAYCPNGYLDAQHYTAPWVYLTHVDRGGAVKESDTGIHYYSAPAGQSGHCTAGEALGPVGKDIMNDAGPAAANGA